MFKPMLQRIFQWIGVLSVIGFIIIFAIYKVRYFSSSYQSPLASKVGSVQDSFGLSASAPMMYDSASSGQERMITPPPVANGGVANAPADRLIIRNGSMSIVVKKVTQVMDSIKTYIEGSGGFVVTSSISGQSNNPTGSITLRIPVKSYDAAYSWVKNQAAKVVSEISSGEDVTEEYTDLASQLRNLRVSEEQFLKIMERSGQIADVLNVQRELERVRGDIERIVGRQQYLDKSAKMATLTVYLSTEEGELPIVNPKDKWEPLTVLKNAIRSVTQFGKELANLIIWLFVYAIVWVPILIIIWWMWRRRGIKS